MWKEVLSYHFCVTTQSFALLIKMLKGNILIKIYQRLQMQSSMISYLM